MKKISVLLQTIILFALNNLVAQNVGIGIANPQTKLHIGGNLSTEALSIGASNLNQGLLINGKAAIADKQYIEFGTGLTKDLKAGKFLFSVFDNSSNFVNNTYLKIYGAGATETALKIKFWAESESFFTGNIFSNGNLQAKSIKTTDGFWLKKLLISANNTANPLTITGPGVTNNLVVTNGGNVGINYNNPQDVSSNVQGPIKSITVNGVIKLDTLITNRIQTDLFVNNFNNKEIDLKGYSMKYEGNSYLKISNSGHVDGGKIGYQIFSNALDIVGIGSASTNRSLEIVSDQVYVTGPVQVAKKTSAHKLITSTTTIQTNNFKLGNNTYNFNDLKHGTITAGAGLPDTLVKVITFNFPIEFTFGSNPKFFATAQGEGNFADVFNITLTEVKNTGVKLIIKRMDITEADLSSGQAGWGQNLKVNWWAFE